MTPILSSPASATGIYTHQESQLPGFNSALACSMVLSCVSVESFGLLFWDSSPVLG